MTQDERRLYLIRMLLCESPELKNISIPSDVCDQRRLLRSLMNIRPPKTASDEFLTVQDAYLKELLSERGVVRLSDLTPVKNSIYLWRGDITRLECGAAVNAANSGMTGCHHPCHGCIDNAIHTYAGVQLRAECASLMEAQGHEEPVGRAKITGAYNLPCDHVIHTVGPAVSGSVTPEHVSRLASCYRSCLELADRSGVDSIAFCCISTGVFGFPPEKAAQTAVGTVQRYIDVTGSGIKVIFNVFNEKDERIYSELLS